MSATASPFDVVIMDSPAVAAPRMTPLPAFQAWSHFIKCVTGAMTLRENDSEKRSAARDLKVEDTERRGDYGRKILEEREKRVDDKRKND